MCLCVWIGEEENWELKARKVVQEHIETACKQRCKGWGFLEYIQSIPFVGGGGIESKKVDRYGI